MAKRLSIVVTGRNDDYDGNFNDRLCIAMGRNLKNLPDAEFIFVEWNPIMDKPLVCDHLRKVFRNRVRCFAVHPRFHDRYCTFDAFNEYPAKNVGIRRAGGDFVCCTNSDIIFAPPLVAALKKPLEPRKVYRARRVDIRPEHLYVLFPLGKQAILGSNDGLMNACGDFLMVDRATWAEFRGYCEAFPEQRLHKDSQMVWLMVEKAGLATEDIGWMTHWRHQSSWSNGFNRPRVGNPQWDFTKCGFERNGEDWGLSFANEMVIEGVTWLV